jgi:hypothetical protein
MHCSVWRFTGDPDELEARYLRLMAEVPDSNHVLHAAAKTADGLLIFDTCPSEEVYHAFYEGPGAELFARHGLVPASREDHPVIRAYGSGARLDGRDD